MVTATIPVQRTRLVFMGLIILAAVYLQSIAPPGAEEAHGEEGASRPTVIRAVIPEEVPPLMELSSSMLLGVIMALTAIGAMAFWRYKSVDRVNRRLYREVSERTRAEDAVRERNTMLQTLIDAIPDQVIFKDANGRYLLVNRAMAETCGLGQDEFLGKTDEQLSPPDVARRCKESDRKAIAQGGPAFSEEYYCNEHGEMRSLEVVKAPIFDSKSELTGVVVVSRDITDRRRMEDALRESERRYHLLFDQSPDGVVLVDGDGKILEFNETAHGQLGYSREEFARLSLADIDLAGSAREIQNKIGQILETGKARFDAKHRTRQGEIRDVDIIAQLTDLSGRQFMYAIWHDITDRKIAEERMIRSLKEKEVLLKEIHHRVKNNMQVIYSLLNLQANGITDKKVLAMFAESRDRVGSMALIHEKLYGSEDLAHIDFKEYLGSLVASIADTYKRREIAIDLDMELITLDVNVGIPCGLIFNELVSNSLKYAFPAGRTGTITLGINKDSQGNHILTVADDGIGLPAGLDFRDTPSLGLKLVSVLTGQLRGTMELAREGGTRFTITFPWSTSPGPDKRGSV